MEDCYSKYRINQLGNRIQFINCHFAKINGTGVVIYVKTYQLVSHSIVSIVNSSFRTIQAQTIVQTDLTETISSRKYEVIIIIHNTTFSAIMQSTAVILLKGTNLLLKGPLNFTHIVSDIIILPINSQVRFKNTIQFSNNHMRYCAVVQNIVMEKNTKLCIRANTFSVFFFTAGTYSNIFHEVNVNCLIQYVQANDAYQLTSNEQFMRTQYKILVEGNTGGLMFNGRFTTSHCDWTAFSQHLCIQIHTQ